MGNNKINPLFYIPKRINDTELSLFGLLSVSRIVEGLIYALPFIVIESFIVSKKIMFLAPIVYFATALFFIILSQIGIKGHRLTKFILIWLKFHLRKRHLSFRQIRKYAEPYHEMPKKNKKTKKDKKIKEKEKQSSLNESEIMDLFSQDLQLLKNNKKEYFTQEIIPYKEIKDGIVITKDEKYLKILEIKPIPFYMYSPEQKEQIILHFSVLLKRLPGKIHIKSFSYPPEMDMFISYLKKIYEGELDENVRYSLEDTIQLMERTSRTKKRNEKKHFIIFEYTNKENYKQSFFEIKEQIEHFERVIMDEISQCENSIKNHLIKDSQGKIFEDPSFLIKIFYFFYNQKSFYLNDTLQKRINMVFEDTMKAKGLTREDNPHFNISLHNILAPRGLDFMNKNYIVMDGMYYTFLAVKNVNNGGSIEWLSQWILRYENVDFDFYFETENSSALKNKLSHMLTTRKGSVEIMPRNSEAKLRTFSEVNDLEYLHNSLSVTQEPITYFTILLTIKSSTKKNLFEKKEQIKEKMNMHNIIELSDLDYMMEDALKSVSFLNSLSSDIKREYAQNALPSAAATCYPFIGTDVKDSEGVFLGLSKIDNSIVTLDLFNTKRVENHNIILVGSTGSGKTFTALLLAERLRMVGVQIIIIAPIKGHEFKNGCTNIGGSFIQFGNNSKYKINPFDILLEVNPNAKIKKEMIETQIKWLLELIERMNDNKLESTIRSLLDKVLTELYAEKGIVDGVQAFVKNDDGEYVLREMPTFEDLYNKLDGMENRELSKLKNLFLSYISGSSSRFNGQTTPNIFNNMLCVFDLSGIEKRELSINLLIVMHYVQTLISADLSKKKYLIIDEMWELVRNSDRKIAKPIEELFRVIRGYGGGCIGITQHYTDLKDEFGSSIMKSTAIRIFLKLDQSEAELAAEELKMTSLCKNIIEDKRHVRGDAVIDISGEIIPISFAASERQIKNYTTDINLRQKMKSDSGKKEGEE